MDGRHGKDLNSDRFNGIFQELEAERNNLTLKSLWQIHELEYPERVSLHTRAYVLFRESFYKTADMGYQNCWLRPCNPLQWVGSLLGNPVRTSAIDINHLI